MKDIKEIINVDSLIDYIGFANTPTYLYKRFRLDDSVADLSKLYSVEQLLAAFMSRINKEEESIEDLAILYACLFALIFKPVDEVYDIMKKMQTAPLRWADKISALYLSSITLDIDDNTDHNYDRLNFYGEKRNSTEIV